MSKRATKFLELVDAHLDGLPYGKARRDFIERQLDRWEQLYIDFQNSEGDSQPGASAYDFIETLGGLGARLEEACRG